MIIKKIFMILACTFDGGIGYNNNLPWKIKSDLIKFKNITQNTSNHLKLNAVIMGNNTYKSLPCTYLPKRVNIVLTRNKEYENKENIIYKNSIKEALDYCNKNDLIESIYIIGGSDLFNYFLSNTHLIEKIYLSLIREKDTYYKSNIFINMKDIFKNYNFIKDNKYKYDSNYISYYLVKKTISKQNIN